MSYDTLKISRVEAIALINQQIQKGDTLFKDGCLLIKRKGNQNISSRDRDFFESSFNHWVNITYSILLRIYTSSKIAMEFKEKSSSKVEYVGSTWIPDIKYYLEKQLVQKLDYLEMLKISFDDFRENDNLTETHKKPKIKQNNISKSDCMVKIKNTVWQDIKNDYGIDKRALGKNSFITDEFKRKIIFRDIEQAYLLSSSGFYKPAVILSGGVIEELLRLYLHTKAIKADKNNFDCYIKACQDSGLLKSAIHRLTDSVRYFRNYVHIVKEISSRDTISKPIAKGAVASIFTVVNDFE